MCCRLCFVGISEEEKRQYRTGELKHIPSVTVDFNRESWADRLLASISGKHICELFSVTVLTLKISRRNYPKTPKI